jgi:formyltetrahydrofolate-dependent phosphoribosylglycinamide formyltransferase
MFERLKKKWNVGWWQFVLIFTTFALGGSLCARVGNWLLSFLLTEKSVLYWIIYVPLITFLWPLCVLLISIPLGQYRFFSNYLNRIWKKMTGKTNPKRIAVFASGKGSNAEVIIHHFKNHPFIRIALIVSNKPDAGVLHIAAANHIPTLLVEKDDFFKGNAYVEDLKNEQIDFIVLAGFLWKVPTALIKAYPQQIINIHPALLPKYGGKGMYGHFVHEAVINNKEKESGISIHYVDEVYDHGEIIFQATCEVKENDTAKTLAGRIHDLEHEHYAKVIEKTLVS